MAFSYVSANRKQSYLLPPSMLDWLDEGHLALFVIDAVEMIDTSAFREVHPNEGAGRPGYDPDMMLALLLYAYCIGMRSSRVIARSCHSDLAFRVICANMVPHFTTIARFRADNEEAICALFIEVLKLCKAAGLASLGQIAIDGTKIGSDAALDANHGATWLRGEIATILAEATKTDATEDAQGTLFDMALVPEELRGRTERLARLQQALAVVESKESAEAMAAAERMQRVEAEASEGRRPRGKTPKDPHAALLRAHADLVATKVQAERAADDPQRAEQVASAEQRLGEAAEAASAAAPAEPAKIVANVTDPQSRIMKTASGWVQGYNVQAAVNEHQVVIACSATQDANDVNQFVPMLQATRSAATAAGVTDQIGLVLADAGYWSTENATTGGSDCLIATTKDWKQRKAAREMGQTQGPPPKGATPLEAMEHRLRTPEGTKAYAARSYTVEPVFGNAKENRGYRRFMRRGQSAAQSESCLIFAAHNLRKIFSYNPSVIFGVA